MTATLSNNITMLVEKESPDDHQWVQFVRDHLPMLKKRAILVVVSKEDAFNYRYRPDLWLDKNGYAKSPLWIMLLINGLSTPDEFVNMETFLVYKSVNPVSDLYRTYVTYLKQLSNAA